MLARHQRIVERELALGAAADDEIPDLELEVVGLVAQAIGHRPAAVPALEALEPLLDEALGGAEACFDFRSICEYARIEARSVCLTLRTEE